MSADPEYQLAIAATARRQLAAQLPEGIAFAAFEFINGPLIQSPHRVGKRLMPPLDDRFSARRGTYRIVYRIDEANQVVIVLAIAPRSDVYRTH